MRRIEVTDRVHEFFRRSEFACKCGCGFDVVDVELLKVLVMVRTFYKNKVIVVSGCRCVYHNESIKGASRSQHIFGKAADIVVENQTHEAIYEFLTKCFTTKYGIGLYSTHVHIDVRSNKARWGSR